MTLKRDTITLFRNILPIAHCFLRIYSIVFFTLFLILLIILGFYTPLFLDGLGLRDF